MKEELAEIRSRIVEYFRERAERGGEIFLSRYDARALDVARWLYPIYQGHPDWPECLSSILMSAAEAFHDRGEGGRALDIQRTKGPEWHLRQDLVFGVYDLGSWNDRLDQVGRRGAYLRELGITHLTVTPVFCAYDLWDGFWRGACGFRDQAGEPSVIGPLRTAADQLRADGIGLGLDFVLNHIAREHPWASRARQGDPYFRDFFLTFPDRTVPDEVEGALRQLGADPNPGRFTFEPALDAWVWTTFSPESWDLNFANPWVFRQMLEELLFLANAGVELLTLRELRFIWKEPGTSCEDLPEVRILLRAFAALTRMASPGTVLAAGDGPGTSDARHYLHSEGLRIANADEWISTLWACLARGDGRWLRLSLEGGSVPPGCVLSASLRSREGLAWGLSAHETSKLGVEAEENRRWLGAFFSGDLAGSFVDGEGIQWVTGPHGESRLLGAPGVLVGLTDALREGDEREIELGMRRLLLIYSVLLSIGTLPQIDIADVVDLGGEGASAFARAGAHPTGGEREDRPEPGSLSPWPEPDSAEGAFFLRLKYLLHLRKRIPPFAGAGVRFAYAGAAPLLGYLRLGCGGRVLCLCNFSGQEQRVPADILEMARLGDDVSDLVTGESVHADKDLLMAPYQFLWLSTIQGDEARGRVG